MSTATNDTTLPPATADGDGLTDGQCYVFPMKQVYGSSVIPDTLVYVSGTAATGPVDCAAACNPLYSTDVSFVGVEVIPAFEDAYGTSQPASLQCFCLAGTTVDTIGGQPASILTRNICGSSILDEGNYAYINVFNAVSVS